MSQARICDRCKKAATAQSATHMETKWMFITTQYDLCPACAEDFKKFMDHAKEPETESVSNDG